MRFIQWLRLTLLAALLPLCACGYTGAGSLPPPSALVYSPGSSVYTYAVAIPSNSPSSSGGVVTSYTVNPLLPAGLSLNPFTGVITGTPTAVSAAVTYTITASNASGSIAAMLNITVNNAAPTALTYTTNPALYTLNVAIAANTPSSTGGAVTMYSVSPTLPAGLSLNPATGVISGVPTASAPSNMYTVTAANSIASTTAILSLTVNNQAATTLAYTPATVFCTSGVTIAPLTPAYAGGAAVFAVIPALPDGLVLNGATGTISRNSLRHRHHADLYCHGF